MKWDRRENGSTMIILSIGMPRAGSGWYYNLTNDLVISAGFQDGREIRQRYHLERILTEVNCNIGSLSTKRLLPVMLPSLLGNTFVIKTHAGPTTLTRSLIRLGKLLPTYIYRDPRDAMLSAFEYGQRGLQKGRPNAFSHLTDFDTSLEFILKYVHISELWLNCKDVLFTRYEDLKTDYDLEVGKLIAFLGIDENNPDIQFVIDRYRPEKANQTRKGTHFSKGVSGRLREVYSKEEQMRLNEKLGKYLERMHYQV